MKSKKVTEAAVIAAMYVALTMVSHAMGLAGGAVQLRFSEALCILPCFTGAAIPGLGIGCALANILTGSVIWDVVFGSAATVLGAVFTRCLRGRKVLATLPPIIANTLIIPFVLKYAYGLSGGVWYFMLTVGIGEILSCGVLGTVLYSALKKAGLAER